MGGKAHIVVAELDLVAATLAEGKPLPGQAGVLTAQPFVPARAYVMLGVLGWLMQTRCDGTMTRLAMRPFASR